MTVAEQPKTKELIRVALPFPPNANNMYRRAGLHMHITPEAKKFKQDAVRGCRLRQPGFAIPSRTPLAIKIVLGCPIARINTLDLDNRLKPVIDAVFEASATKANDAWIRRMEVEKLAVAGEGYVTVALEVME